jgi:hypothetical protein
MPKFRVTEKSENYKVYHVKAKTWQEAKRLVEDAESDDQLYCFSEETDHREVVFVDSLDDDDPRNSRTYFEK